MTVPRTGGYFGGKVDPSAGVLAALATHHTSRPVRLVYDLAQCMEAPCFRPPLLAKYKVSAGLLGAGVWQLKQQLYNH